ncbi:MAG: hypothetical protein R3C49_17620 [Planctomycetaceae bacterium]
MPVIAERSVLLAATSILTAMAGDGITNPPRNRAALAAYAADFGRKFTRRQELKHLQVLPGGVNGIKPANIQHFSGVW